MTSKADIRNRRLATRLLRGAIITFAVALTLGCNQSQYEMAKVTGVVTLDGKPFVWGSVSFAPVTTSSSENAGKPAFGMLDSEGRFELSTYSERDGAVVGQHRVTVFCVEDGANGKAPSWVPEFRRLALRGDAMTVKADGENEFEINITSEELKKYGSNR